MAGGDRFGLFLAVALCLIGRSASGEEVEIVNISPVDSSVTSTAETASDLNAVPATTREVSLMPVASSAVVLHQIQVGDELEIRFPYRPLPLPVDRRDSLGQSPPAHSELVLVRDDGRIVLPLIEPVVAAGKTPEVLQAELIAAFQALAADDTQGMEERQFLLSPNDQVEIRFRYQPELNQTVLIRPDGRVNLFHVNAVMMAGKTPEQVDEELTRAYSGVIDRPEISVNVTPGYQSRTYVGGRLDRAGLRDIDGLTVIVRGYERQVYVTGEVNSPRIISYRGSLTVAQAITAAGGAKRSARLAKVMIARMVDGTNQRRCLCCDMSDTLRGTGCVDCALQHKDVVVVPKTAVAKTKDFLDQYVYDIFPWTRNTPSFTLFYNLNPASSLPLGAVR
jgi:protein involved in polysaccharide export with SLBB domain